MILAKLLSGVHPTEAGYRAMAAAFLSVSRYKS